MAERVSQWLTAGVNPFSDWRTSRQNEAGDMVSLEHQTSGRLVAHPLPMGKSRRAVGFIRPGPIFGRLNALGLSSSLIFEAPLDYMALTDDVILGTEDFSDPLGIG